MRKFYTLLLFAFYIIKVTHAQTISGIISDKVTAEKLIGVNIISNNGKGAATDINGKYSLRLDAGNYQITYKYLGYKSVIKEISLKNGEQKNLDIKLMTATEHLGTVVVSAGKFEQRLEEITISMEVIKPSLIENKNTTNIQTALDQVPGVNITDGQANIRGGSGWSYGAGSRVLVMVDDIPLISGDAGQVQWKLIATENINQVEVIKGASSVLYGSSALNGVINIRTAFPTQKDIDKNTTSVLGRNLPGYSKVNMHFGLIDKPEREELNWNGEKRRAFKGVEFLHAMKLNNLDLSLGGNIFKDDGYRQGEITDRKRFNINSTYRSKKFRGLSYGINGNFLFQSSGSVIIWKSLQEAYIPLDGISTTNGDTYNVDPFITYIQGNNRHSLRTRYLKVINDNSTKGEDDNQDNESEIYFSDYQWQKNLEKYNLRITSGTTNEIAYGRAELFQGSNSRKNHSLYTQLDKKWGKLNLSLGTRYEYFSIDSETDHVVDGDTINHIATGKPVFRTGLNYQIAEHTYIRSSWGQGYRFPSMAELFISTNQSGFEIYPNSELKPESGWSAEIGIKQGVRLGNWMGYLDVAGFLMQYEDMMEFSFGPWGDPNTKPMQGFGFKSLNVGKTQIGGLEISLNGQGKINDKLTINVLAGYTYMNHKSLTPDEVYGYGYNHGDTIEDVIYDQSVTYNNSSSDSTLLKYRYNHIAKLDLEIIYKKLSIGGSFRSNDFMRNIDKIFTTAFVSGDENMVGMIPGINDAREKFKDGDFLIDTRIGYQYNDNIRVSFIIDNLLNREYMSRPADMRPPRMFALQMSLKI